MAAICLAPQFSELSVGLYMKRTVEAAPVSATLLGQELP